MLDLEKTLPPSTVNSRGIGALLRACGLETGQTEREARAACLRLAASLCDGKGAALWERELGLEAREDLPLESRRVLILVALEQLDTCTPRRLLAFLGRMLEGESQLREIFPSYRLQLTVQVARFCIPSLRMVEKALRRAIPAHLEAALKALVGLDTLPQSRRQLFQGVDLDIHTTEEAGS